MISLAANWLAAARKPYPELVWYIDIQTDGSTHYYARKGYSEVAAVAAYPATIDSVTPVSYAIDPLTRKHSVGSVSIRFLADGWAKALVIAKRLRGKRIDIKLGFRGIALADFANYAVQRIIDDVQVEPDGAVTLKAVDAFGLMRDKQIVGYWVAQHPLAIAKDIAEKCGVQSGCIDATSLDPTDAANAAIGHWNCGRSDIDFEFMELLDERSVLREPVNGLQVMDEIGQMLPGALVVLEDGIFQYVPFDTGAAVQATLTDDDLDNDDIEIEETDGNAINRVVIEYGKRSSFLLRRDDTGSQTAFALSTVSDGVYSKTIRLPWVNAAALLVGADMDGATPGPESPAVGATFDLAQGSPWGFVGARWPSYPGTAQPASAAVDGTHLAYVQIDDEIIACDVCTPSTTEADTATIESPLGLWEYDATQLVDAGPFPGEVTYRVQDRGALGTTSADHDESDVSSIPPVITVARDCTIPVAVATNIINRWSYGVPIIKVRVGIDQYGLQVTDLIQVDTDRFFATGFSNADDIVWEIIGKEPDFDSDNPALVLTLAYATQTSPLSPVFSCGSGIGSIRRADDVRSSAIAAADTFKTAASGLTVAAVSLNVTLGYTVAVGRVTAGIYAKAKRGTTTFTALASKDTYVYYSTMNGALTVRATTLGAGAPTIRAGHILIGKVVSNGTAVTSVTNYTNTTRLADDIVVESVIANYAVTSTKTIDDGNLGDNTNFELGDRGWPTKQGTWEIAADAEARTGSYCARTVAGGTAAMRNAKTFRVEEADQVYAEAWFKCTAGASGDAAVRISWLDAAKAELSTTNGTSVTAQTSYTKSSVTGTAPATAKYGRLELLVVGALAGTWYGDDAVCRTVATSALVASGAIVDAHIGAGAAIGGTKMAPGAGVFTHLDASGVFDSLQNVTTTSIDYIDDSATYKRVAAAAVGTDNKIDFNLAGFLNKTLDYISDGTSYKRIAAAGVTTGTINSSGLAAQAVNAAALANTAIAPVHLSDQASGSSASFNHNFATWTRG